MAVYHDTHRVGRFSNSFAIGRLIPKTTGRFISRNGSASGWWLLDGQRDHLDSVAQTRP